MDQPHENERQGFILRRARAPTTHAAVFIENNKVVPSPAGTSASVYIDSLDRFGSVVEARKQDELTAEMWKRANEEMEKLFGLIEQVRGKLDKKSSGGLERPARVDMRQSTWEQVMEEVQAAAMRWSSTPKKSSKIKSCLDKLGQNSDVFKAWLEMLPAGDYGSSICGVFKIAVGAIGSFAKAETAVLETLAEIPEVMEDARRYIEIYGKCRDQLLEKKTFELFLSILRTLTQVMQFFADSTFRKVYQPVLHQSSYKSELLASCGDIKLRASRIKNEANICMQKRMGDMNQALQINNELLLATKDNAELTRKILEDLYYRLFLSSEARVASGPGGFHGLGIQDTQAMPKAEAANTEDRVSVEERSKLNLTRAKDVLETLHYDPNILLNDTETILELGATFDETAKARAAALITHPAFKSFLTSPSSAPLLVNGNDDLSAAEGISPLSLVAARLLHEQANTAGFVVGYFCGEHRAPILSPPAAQKPKKEKRKKAQPSEEGTAPLSSSQAKPPKPWPIPSSAAGKMLANLTGQLLTLLLARRIDIDLTRLEQRSDPLVRLSCLFYELVHQLPPNTVLLCIVDEIALYETGVPDRDRDVRDVVRRLERCARECEGRTVFKLLVLCRGRALDIGRYFGQEITLELAAEVEEDDASSFRIASLGRGEHNPAAAKKKKQEEKDRE